MRYLYFIILTTVYTSGLSGFTRKSYENYNQFGTRYFLNALYYEHTGNSERAAENLEIAYLRTNSDALKLELALRNMISGKSEEGQAALRELYDSGYDLGRYAVYLFTGSDKDDRTRYGILEKVITGSAGKGEINTAAEIAKFIASERVYDFGEAAQYEEYIGKIIPDELNPAYDMFFNSVLLQLRTKVHNDAEGAVSVIREMEEKYRELPYSFYQLAFSEFLDMKELDKAKLILDKMSRYNYGEPGYYYDMSDFFSRVGETEKASRVLLEGIRMFGDTALKLKLARTYLAAGDTVRSSAVYSELIKEFPEDDSLYEIIANEYSLSGRKNKALEYYEEAHVRFPDDPQILNNYAYMLAVEGKEPDKALKMVGKALESEPGSVTYLDTKAWVLYRMGRAEEAEKIMDGIFSDENSYYHQSSEELYGHYMQIKKDLGKEDQVSGMTLNSAAVVLSEIINRSSYLFRTGFQPGQK